MQTSTSIMKTLATFLLVASMVAISHGANRFLNYPLRLRSDGGDDVEKLRAITCSAWWYAVETNSINDWKTVPAKCEEFVKNYFDSQEYQNQSNAVRGAAFAYAQTLNLTNDGKDIWIFDVDDTAISNLPYYEKHGYGTEEFNHTSFDEWLEQGEAPALSEALYLYEELLSLGIKIMFLTERGERHKEITTSNLNNAGYFVFEEIITNTDDSNLTSGEFKLEQRKLLEEQGYIIRGTIGDQWSDFRGGHAGRTFKLPNPLYHIG